MGIAIERNRGGLSLDDVGTQVDLGGLWGRTSLTADLVDGGLNQVHKFLTVEADGQHFAAKGLERVLVAEGDGEEGERLRVELLRRASVTVSKKCNGQ